MRESTTAPSARWVRGDRSTQVLELGGRGDGFSGRCERVDEAHLRANPRGVRIGQTLERRTEVGHGLCGASVSRRHGARDRIRVSDDDAVALAHGLLADRGQPLARVFHSPVGIDVLRFEERQLTDRGAPPLRQFGTQPGVTRTGDVIAALGADLVDQRDEAHRLDRRGMIPCPGFGERG